MPPKPLTAKDVKKSREGRGEGLIPDCNDLLQKAAGGRDGLILASRTEMSAPRETGAPKPIRGAQRRRR